MNVFPAGVVGSVIAECGRTEQRLRGPFVAGATDDGRGQSRPTMPFS